MILNARVKNVIKNNSNWFLLALVIFLLGIAAPATFFTPESLFSELTREQVAALEELGRLVFSGSPLSGIALLFANNLVAVFNMVVLGIILGIPPLLGLFANGNIMGIVAASLQQEGVGLVPFFLLGVAPHGIFELPAFFISAGLGLKIGFHILFPLPGRRRGESLRIIWSEILTVAPLIILLLLVAAFVEVVITPQLLPLYF